VDLDYFPTEITFVNCVRDRADADVHILTTTRATGGGGREFPIALIGLRNFAGQKNTLTFASKPAETEDTMRKQLARYFKIGLIPIVSKSPAVERIDVAYRKAEEEKDKSKAVKDPWDCLTFRTSIRVHCNGEKTYKSTYNNRDLSFSFSPGLEYNVFPHSESTRRLFTFQYLVAGNHFDNHEETIYLKSFERRFTERLNMTYEVRQPWGSIRSSLYNSNYQDGMEKYNIQW
jgi:hypothetical protein